MRQIDTLLNPKNGIITSAQVKALGRGAYYSFLAQKDEGDFSMLKNGVYIRNDALASTMIDFSTFIPGGVLCLYSAWFHYGLTTQIPSCFYVAVPRNVKISVPAYPPFKIMRWGGATYELGITRQTIQGIPTRIYDVEKSVCDAIKFRNKIGMDIMTEILRSYLSGNDRNLPKLEQYAKQLRVYNTLKPYLEISI